MDVWSLGVLVSLGLTNQHPFENEETSDYLHKANTNDAHLLIFQTTKPRNSERIK